MNKIKLVVYFFGILFLASCSYNIKPIPTDPLDISRAQRGQFDGNSELTIQTRTPLAVSADNQSSMACKPYNYTVDLTESINGTLTDYFALVFNGKDNPKYSISLLISDLKVDFKDNNEFERLLMGVFAGKPNLSSRSFVSIDVKINKDGHIVFDKKLKAEGTNSSTYFTCSDIVVSIRNSVSNMVAKLINKLDSSVYLIAR